MSFIKIGVVLIGIISLILVGAVLKIASEVLLPLVIAVFIALILAPLFRILEKIRVPRLLAIPLVLLFLFGIFFLVFLFFQASVSSFMNQYPKYVMRFTELSIELNNFIEEQIGVEFSFFEGISWPGTLRNYLMLLSGSVVNFVSSFTLIMIFLIFLLLEKPYFSSRLTEAFDLKTGSKISSVIEQIARQVTRYLNIKTLVSLFTGLLVWFLLSILGMDFAFIWGALTFLLNFIPSIGSVIVSAIIILMAIIQFFPAWGIIITIAVLASGIQFFIGNFIDPRLQGRRLNLSPFVILVSLIFWGWIWGIAGMFLAVPITVIIQIVCENISFLRPISVLIGRGSVKQGNKKSTGSKQSN